MRFEVLVRDLKFGDKVPARYTKGQIIETMGERETGKALVLTKTRPPALRVAPEAKPVRHVATMAAPPRAVQAEATEGEHAPTPHSGRYRTRRLKTSDED